MSEDVELCTICNVSEAEHNARHVFTPQGTRVDTSQFARKRRKGSPEGDPRGGRPEMPQAIAQTPFDPVLRQALLDKGILTVEDLEEAQRKITVMTNLVMQMPPGLRGGDDGSR